MALVPFLVILVLVNSTFQDITNNKVDDSNPFAEAAAAILKEQNAQSIGGMLNNMIQSDGAKQLGDILSSAASSENMGDILQGLGSVMSQNKGLDLNLLGTVVDMFQSSGTPGKKSEEGFDPSILLSLLGNFMGQSTKEQNLMSYIPMIMQTAGAFFGPEAKERAHRHTDHADMLPPFLEKIHVLFDHFMNSELGNRVVTTLGGEKFVKVFADENGRFSFKKFTDMMENQSFRKHWIRMITSRIAAVVNHFSDAKVQKKYLATVQLFINGILKTQGYPKSALFNFNRPTETISAMINHFAKETLNMKISSKQYVKPAVEYIKELFLLTQKKSIFTDYLSDKLADTINFEVIEPLARVNRAYRFAMKVPQCDRYVMCLVNQETQHENSSLPGLTPLLSKSASFIMAWFLSSQTQTSFFSYYATITEPRNCQALFLDKCHDFNVEEKNLQKEYVHSEL